MLEHVPHWLGHALRGLRAGADKLVIADPDLLTEPEAAFAALNVTSPAFANGARLPVRFTADGPGVSPPLLWSEPPQGTRSLALVVEDPDAPTPSPLVHAVVWGLGPDARSLAEGAIAVDGAGAGGVDVGRNSARREGWLPPDPPTGHGVHSYAFQLFALSATPDLAANPGRSAVTTAMRGHILAAGILTGTYSRGEESGASLGLVSGGLVSPGLASSRS